MTDRDDLPGFVSSELGEREPVRHAHGVLVLRDDRARANDSEHGGYGHGPDTRAPHFRPPFAYRSLNVLGADAFKRDIPGAVVRFFETGHFALETHAGEIAAAIRDFYRP